MASDEVPLADWQVDAPVHEVKDLSLAVLRRQRAESDANLNGYLSPSSSKDLLSSMKRFRAMGV